MKMPRYFEPGEVVMCTDDRHAPMLRKGALYRVSARVPETHGYRLEGVVTPDGFQGFHGARFTEMACAFTPAGPIRRSVGGPP